MDRCSHCRAPLPATPDRSRRHCPRCGAPLAAPGDRVASPAPSPEPAAAERDEAVAWARRLAGVLLDDIRLYRPELLTERSTDGPPAGPLAAELAAAWSWWRERVTGEAGAPERLFREVATRHLGIAWPTTVTSGGDDHGRR